MSNARNLSKLLGTDTQITAADIAEGVFQANKNIIINGAMTVNQRGNVTGATGSTYGGPDRFYTIIGNGIGTWNITQDTDVPSGQGFANSWKLACTTADASPAAADHLGLHYRMEGQDLQQLSKGTSSAKSVTLSFWVKCNKTGNFQVSFYDSDNLRHIASTVTISSAATWQYVEITFAGDTTGAFNNDNGVSAYIEIFFDGGTDWTSGSVPTTWQSATTANRAAGTNLALADSTSNYINITGVQLELGSTATPFEHRSYGDELAKCQRYYQIQGQGTFYAGTTNGTSQVRVGLHCPMPMRAQPTVAILGTGNTMIAWHSTADGIASTSQPTVSTFSDEGLTSSFRISCSGFSGMTDNRVATATVSADKLTLDAEL